MRSSGAKVLTQQPGSTYPQWKSTELPTSHLLMPGVMNHMQRTRHSNPRPSQSVMSPVYGSEGDPLPKAAQDQHRFDDCESVKRQQGSHMGILLRTRQSTDGGLIRSISVRRL